MDKNIFNIKGSLISFQNTIGYHLDGIYYKSYNSKKVIIHIHGSYGNFYHDKFIKVMAKIYTESGYNFFSFNLTCHDGFSEGYKNKNVFEYIGGAVSDFLTCISDIEGAIQFVAKFNEKIILQGHSLGCDRVVYYLLTSGQKYDFILLGACDSCKLHSIWLKSETVEQQIQRLKLIQYNNLDFDWLPINEYGIYNDKEDYILPITRKALLSIISGPPFILFNIDNPIDYFLDLNCFLYIGQKDKLQTEEPGIMINFFKARIKHLETFIVKDGDHMMTECEETVAKKIIEWLNNNNY
ncbi:MAG: hypothetical protein NT007_08060 [Candidatus Kapabacteria bacterium]|nr:hypothetical protein [Candidatus Kapabacteria bacterium]